MESDVFDIVFFVYLLILILAFYKKAGIYNILSLQRMRNRVLLVEGFLILLFLALPKPQVKLLSLPYIGPAIVLGGFLSIAYFFFGVKKYISDGIYTAHWQDKLWQIWRRRFWTFMIIGWIISGTIYGIVYESFFKGKYPLGEFSAFYFFFGAVTVLSGVSMYLILIMLLELDRGPIYYDKETKPWFGI